jgi:DNA-binding Xre family transcriptional regulator
VADARVGSHFRFHGEYQASKAAGFTNAQQWHLIESGRRSNITMDTLGKIAKALGVKSKDLLK